MSSAVPFDDYLSSLSRLTAHVDPTDTTPEMAAIKIAAAELAALPRVDVPTLATWIEEHPNSVPILGLAVGLSQEKLLNSLRNAFNTSGYVSLARNNPVELISWLDSDFEVVRLLRTQLRRQYHFGDVLIARAGSRVTAARAGASGRKVEDEIEAIVANLGLPYQTRTRFIGRNAQTAPCDLVVPNSQTADIVVAAKGFDSTGSKLGDAVREIVDIAHVRLSRQHVIAVIDGIGWKSRRADLRRIHDLWVNNEIDGMYTLSSLDEFGADVKEAAILRHLLPPNA